VVCWILCLCWCFYVCRRYYQCWYFLLVFLLFLVFLLLWRFCCCRRLAVVYLKCISVFACNTKINRRLLCQLAMCTEQIPIITRQYTGQQMRFKTETKSASSKLFSSYSLVVPVPVTAKRRSTRHICFTLPFLKVIAY
jgi:hypothetical protein